MAQKIPLSDYSSLLIQIAAGDKLALQTIYQQEAAKLIGVAYRIVRNKEKAEDVVQETFVRIWRKAALYQAELGSAKSWIYAICHNLALNALRDEKHIATDDTALFSLVDAPENHDTPYEALGDDEALKKCLAQLDEKRRASIMLAYCYGYSHGEIAGKLNLPLGTVKAWIRRSLISLRECLT